MKRHLAILLGVGMPCLLAASCSQPASTVPQSVATPVARPAEQAAAPARAAALDLDLLTEQRDILAAQRALTQLGYNLGKSDGVSGPATHHAVQLFQKDHDLAEDGRLTFALAKMLGSLVAQLPEAISITVETGDRIIFSDGSIENVAHERIVQWGQEGNRTILAVRPSTTGWPPAARAGLEWATTHALDEGNGANVQWSSTGVAQHFEIHVFPVLSPHEAALAGASLTCRHFELRADDRRYPGLACKDAKGDWFLPHTSIRLARPATALGLSADSPLH